jgi:hypothetical protein
MALSLVNRAEERISSNKSQGEEVMRTRIVAGLSALAVALSWMGAAAADQECEDKCEKAYKGKSWWIDNCKKTKCKSADLNKAAEDLKKKLPGVLVGGPPANSCAAQCEKNYQGKPWWIDKCKKDRKCDAPPPPPATTGGGTAGAATGSCAASCEKAYFGKSWWIDKCKKDKKCAEVDKPKLTPEQEDAAYSQCQSTCLPLMMGCSAECIKKYPAASDRWLANKKDEDRRAGDAKDAEVNAFLAETDKMFAVVNDAARDINLQHDKATECAGLSDAAWNVPMCRSGLIWRTPLRSAKDPTRQENSAEIIARIGLPKAKEMRQECIDGVSKWIAEAAAKLTAFVQRNSGLAGWVRKRGCAVLEAMGKLGDTVLRIFEWAKEHVFKPVWEWAKEQFHKFAQKSPYLKPIDDLIRGGSLANSVQELTKELAKGGREKLVDYLATLLVNAVAKKPLRDLAAWAIKEILAIADPILNKLVGLPVTQAIIAAIGFLQTVPVVGQAIALLSPIAGPIAAGKLIKWIRSAAAKKIADVIMEKAAGLFVPIVRPLVNFAYDKLVGILRAKFPAVFAQVETTGEEKKAEEKEKAKASAPVPKPVSGTPRGPRLVPGH